MIIDSKVFLWFKFKPLSLLHLLAKENKLIWIKVWTESKRGNFHLGTLENFSLLMRNKIFFSSCFPTFLFGKNKIQKKIPTWRYAYYVPGRTVIKFLRRFHFARRLIIYSKAELYNEEILLVCKDNNHVLRLLHFVKLVDIENWCSFKEGNREIGEK